MTLERPTFATSRFVETYDMAEVDAAIDRIFVALGEQTPSMTPTDVQELRFTPTRLREGYLVGAVDEWLDEAAAALAQRADGAAPVPATASAREPAYAPTASDAIVEVGGGRSSAAVALVVVVLVALAIAAYVYYA